MLYVNSKFVELDKEGIDPKEPKDLYEKVILDYRKKLSEYKQRFGRYVTVKDRREPKLNITGLLEPVPNAAIPLRLALVGENGREEWVYTEVTPQLKEGVLHLDTNSRIIYYGELRIDLQENPDLAYFLLEKHPMFKKGRYYVEDFAADERKKAEGRRNETKLFEVIYGGQARLNMDLAYLRLIAKRWGISSADTQSKDFLQNNLYDRVKTAEEKKRKSKAGRGIDEFINDVRASDSNEQLQVAGHVRDAMDKNILTFDVGDKTWKINYGDGTFYNVLSVSAQDLPQKEEAVILYLQEDNSIYSKLMSAMGADKGQVTDVINPSVVRETEDYSVLRAYAKSLDIIAYQKSKEDLRIAILTKLQEQGKI